MAFPFKMTCMAIDDEPLALEVISVHTAKIPFLDLRATFVSPTEALGFLKQQPVDLIFLDVNMPDINGVDLARLTGRGTKIIFTTAYPEFAVQGFELAATDYLLKPFGFSRFLQACTRAWEQFSEKAGAQPAADACLFVKEGYDWVRIDLEELAFVEADGNYVTFNTAARRTLARMKLSEAVQKLPADHFIQVHKSYVVAVAKIGKIERHQVTVAGTTIPLSSTYRAIQMERFPFL